MTRSPDRFRRLVFSALGFAGLLGALLSGCNTEGSTLIPVDRPEVNEATPILLPTPTLAAPGSVDPLRPPTPVVLPSPTSQSSQTEAPSAAPGAVPVDSASLTTAEVTPPAIALPQGASPQDLLELGRRSAAEGDQSRAAAAFRATIDQPGNLDEGAIAEARLGLAMALLAEGQADEAAIELETLVQVPQMRANIPKAGALVGPVNVAEIAMFNLGRARAATGDHAGAIEAYKAYLQTNPDMSAYVQPQIADAYEALGDTNGVITALESALDAPAHRFTIVANRLRLASLYLTRGDFAAAIAQYDAIHDIARTEATKGQMTYLAGQAEIMSGNVQAGYERFQSGINKYPRSAESYQALIALIDAGIPVDEYQRGVVDFYAGAFLPAIDAFRRAVVVAPEGYNKDVHVYMAWSFEGLGDIENALTELDAFAEYEPARALFERGELLRRAGRSAEALAVYDSYLESYPEAEDAAGVAWLAAELADTAVRYLFLADTFPFDENTPYALFRAAELTAASDRAGAVALQERLAEQYPANIYGAEALFKLMQSANSGETEGLDASALAKRVETLSLSNYFALRAADYVAGIAPFTADESMILPDTPATGQAEAETWLRERLTAAGNTLPDGDLSALSTGLADDPQRIVGEKLWQLGLLEEAKAELETVRETYADDPLANYQLALYFAELGLYRSSIIASSALLRQTNATVFDAPRFLGRLSYPTYYADLILPLAENFDFDPRLQFALVRQESLFESFARSGAAAQGLSQVIPDTGAWIAQRLDWPNFVNEDLYKPYVGLNFGAYYLSEQLKNFDGHVHAALAAYNGGPGNAARWSQAAGNDFDRFVDTIDFPETRLYIERIYEGFNAYRYLYGNP